MQARRGFAPQRPACGLVRDPLRDFSWLAFLDSFHSRPCLRLEAVGLFLLESDSLEEPVPVTDPQASSASPYTHSSPSQHPPQESGPHGASQ